MGSAEFRQLGRLGLLPIKLHPDSSVYYLSLRFCFSLCRTRIWISSGTKIPFPGHWSFIPTFPLLPTPTFHLPSPSLLHLPWPPGPLTVPLWTPIYLATTRRWLSLVSRRVYSTTYPTGGGIYSAAYSRGLSSADSGGLFAIFDPTGSPGGLPVPASPS